MTIAADYFPCTARKKFLEGFYNMRVTGELEAIYCNRVLKPLTQTGTLRANVLAKNFARSKAFSKIPLS
jgi:hypothetical protein